MRSPRREPIWRTFRRRISLHSGRKQRGCTPHLSNGPPTSQTVNWPHSVPRGRLILPKSSLQSWNCLNTRNRSDHRKIALPPHTSYTAPHFLAGGTHVQESFDCFTSGCLRGNCVLAVQCGSRVVFRTSVFE